MNQVLRNSKTAKNLATAFSIKSDNAIRYLGYRETIKKEGYENIALLYEVFANHEKWHSWSIYKYLDESFHYQTLTPPTYVPVHAGTTAEILYQTAVQERLIHQKVLPEYAATAKQEGYTELETLFNNIQKIDMFHEQLLMNIHFRFKNDMLYKSTDTIVWRCQKCGFYYIGKNAPDVCPVCQNIKTAFSINCPNNLTRF